MPIAHTCTSCGLSLTRIAAPLDPIYRLPLVICPECRAPSVRASDGHRAVPRALNRIRLAITTAVSNILWTIIAAAACAGFNIAMAEDLDRSGMTAWSCLGMLAHVIPSNDGFAGWIEDDGSVKLIAWVCLNVVTGAFLAGALPHLRRRVFVPLFVALVSLLLFVPDTINLIHALSDGATEQLQRPLLANRFREVLGGIRILPAAALTALAGIPLGLRLSRSAAAVRTRARRRLRARTRRRRQGL